MSEANAMYERLSEIERAAQGAKLAAAMQAEQAREQAEQIADLRTRLETVTQAAIAAGADLNDAAQHTPLTVAVRAAAVMAFGDDAAKAGYLRGRGWICTGRWWANREQGRESVIFDAALKDQIQADIKPFWRMMDQCRHVMPIAG